MDPSAVHEAGHAWAYHRANKPLRYVTLRPREAGVSGLCRPWKPRRLDLTAYALIASSGPIAEAMSSFEAEGGELSNALDSFDFGDHLSGAVLAGGHDDLRHSLGMLDDPSAIDYLRAELARDWSPVQTLARLLSGKGTVPGRTAFEVLSRG